MKSLMNRVAIGLLVLNFTMVACSNQAAAQVSEPRPTVVTDTDDNFDWGWIGLLGLLGLAGLMRGDRRNTDRTDAAVTRTSRT